MSLPLPVADASRASPLPKAAVADPAYAVPPAGPVPDGPDPAAPDRQANPLPAVANDQKPDGLAGDAETAVGLDDLLTEPAYSVRIHTRDSSLAVQLRALLAHAPGARYDATIIGDAPLVSPTPADEEGGDKRRLPPAPVVPAPDIRILCHGRGDDDPLATPVSASAEAGNGQRAPFIVVGNRTDAALDKLALQRGAADYLVAAGLSAGSLDRALRYAIQRHKAANAMTRMAMYDELTGLYNRSMFEELLRHAVQRARRSQRRLSLMFIDLDRFKTVNDTLGHAFGDRLLTEVSSRLRDCLRATDMICRLGGDEFTVILEGGRSSADTATVARKILDALSAPFLLQGKEVFISASIGIAEFPDSISKRAGRGSPKDDKTSAFAGDAIADGGVNGGSDADTLIANADMAMYRAKNRGRACFTFFTPEFSRVARRRAAIEDLLRAALDKGGLELSYQPQIDLQTNDVIGFESLVRLNDKAFGALMPGEFIPIAEESGLIHRLGAWVVEEACRQGRVWDNGGLGDFRLSVNLSARQFQRNDVIATVGKALARSGFPAHRLDLELTESHLAADPDAAASALARLRRMGIGVAVDDFGTGYSSLLMLKRLPVTWLKIDRSFVAGLPDREEDHAIAEAIVRLAHSLDLRVIAEGVETADQLAALRTLGCDAAQGYLFSPPLGAADVPRWLRAAAKGGPTETCTDDVIPLEPGRLSLAEAALDASAALPRKEEMTK